MKIGFITLILALSATLEPRAAELRQKPNIIHLNTGITDTVPKKGAKNKAAGTEPPEVRLFNLEADPTERDNMAAEKPEVVRHLELLMWEAWHAP